MASSNLLFREQDWEDYVTCLKKTVIVSPWQCVPYVNIRDICVQGPEYETLRSRIIDHGIMSYSHVHVVKIKEAEYTEDLRKLMSADLKRNVDWSKDVYGIVDGAHRVTVVQKLLQVISNI